MSSDKGDVQTLIELFELLASEQNLSLMQAGRNSYTGEEIYGQVKSLAARLQSAGLEAGERVVVSAPPSSEWVAAAFAVIYAGGVLVPLDDQTSADELQAIIADCEPRFVFAASENQDKFSDLVEDSSLHLLDASEAEIAPDSLPAADHPKKPSPDPEETVVQFYTSGTTGLPKGVPLSHSNLLFSVRAIDGAGLARPGDRMLLPLPFHHVYPFVIGLLTPVFLGIPVILPEAVTGPAIISAINEGKVSIVIGVPRLYRALNSGIKEKINSAPPGLSHLIKGLLGLSAFLRRRLGISLGKKLLFFLHRKLGPRLRLLASGGSQLPEQLAWKLEGLGWKVAVGYGLSETSPLLTLLKPDELKFNTVGRALPGVELKISEEEHEGTKPTDVIPGEVTPDLSRGNVDPESMEDHRKWIAGQARNDGGAVGSDEETEKGELLARGPNVFSGYYNRPEETEEAFVEGWFRTGDLGCFDGDDYLELGGRVSTMIVTESGKNIQPADLEEKYAGHPLIEEIGVLKEEGGLAAVVIPNAEQMQQRGENDPRDAVYAALSEVGRELPSYQQIQKFEVDRGELERTRLGKLRRHLLQKRYEELASDSRQIKQGTPIEVEQMSESAQELLQTSECREVWDWLADKFSDYPLTMETNFQFDLGVDSLEWVNYTLTISSLTGVDLSEEALARVETVRDLLEEVKATGGGDVSAELTGDLFANPEEFLDSKAEKWLAGPGAAGRFCRRLLFLTNKLACRAYFRPEAHGLENLPDDGNFILAPNHLSYLDPFVLASVLDYDLLTRTRWAAWSQVAFTNPLNKTFSYLAGAVPVDPLNNLVTSLAYGAAVLRRGHNLVWFPEGRRSLDGDLQPFRPGLGMLVSKIPRPVVPVRIDGTYRSMPPGQALPRPSSVKITFGAPLNFDELGEGSEAERDYEAFTSALQKRVKNM